MTLKDWLKKRDHGALTMLAAKAGVSRQTIYRLINGKPTTDVTARAVRRATRYRVDLSSQVSSKR